MVPAALRCFSSRNPRSLAIEFGAHRTPSGNQTLILLNKSQHLCMNHQWVLTFLKYEVFSQLNSVGQLYSEVFSATLGESCLDSMKGVALAENDQLNSAQFKAHAMHRLRIGHTADSRVPPAVVSQLGAVVASHSDASLHSPARGRMCNEQHVWERCLLWRCEILTGSWSWDSYQPIVLSDTQQF